MQGRWDAARFALLLDTLTHQAKLSQRSLAQQAGLDPSVVSRWHRRPKPVQPSYDNLCAVALALAKTDPVVAERVPDLMVAAGYGALTVPAQEMPEIVALNWNHPDAQVRSAVREIWGMTIQSPDWRAGAIMDVLATAAGRQERRAGLTGLAPAWH